MARAPTPRLEEVVASGSVSVPGGATAEHQSGVAVPRADGSSTLEQFLRLHPPCFKGEADPRGAESWLKRVSKIFDAMQTSEERRLTLVPYLFEDEADFWWDLVTRTEDVAQMSWEEFKTLFLAKYFPEVERDARREEFERLTQRGLTVAQYEARFTELSRYAEYMVDSEAKKVYRFVRGLRPTIQSQLTVLMLTQYRDAVNRALVVERGLDERQRFMERSGGKRNSDRPGSSGTFKKRKNVEATPQQSQNMRQGFQQRRPGLCDKCGQPGHIGRDCRNCFNCGQPGHTRWKCPSAGQQGGD